MNLENLKNIIANNFGVKKEEIKMESNLQDDLGLDSLDAVELSMAIEEETGKEIPDEEFQKFITVEDLINFLNK
ncbi:MAG: acyl carrier protein [Peptoniphilus harei]|uniref:Acyl carrier protein n=3 Tax=Peptoniphilus TaxID=162289 RepID=E4L110_9FIRM|nr:MULTISPECIES: acyl carrier protein [Peptoniphilus]MDU4448129.1 acyl carrier protein [Anaerococcus vaginalis]EFR32210.1 putative acyl carrier protein [Peptoniphilus harei ACS-146-V-Sch2b]KXA29692.1 acyl carrier protein [Peptoniphilus harei]KXB70913.1 acyl carrier protein [Peptoniphilus sp. DNF00840]MDK7377362.1 acyl carrier protein [Peptoniphilus harei]